MKTTAILILVIYTLTSCQYDGAREIIKSSEYKGVIIDTYRQFNHNVAIFKIKTHDSSLEMNPDSWPKLWEYAKIGDSIIKQKDTFLILVKKNDSTKEEFFYDPFRRGLEE